MAARLHARCPSLGVRRGGSRIQRLREELLINFNSNDKNNNKTPHAREDNGNDDGDGSDFRDDDEHAGGNSAVAGTENSHGDDTDNDDDVFGSVPTTPSMQYKAEQPTPAPVRQQGIQTGEL